MRSEMLSKNETYYSHSARTDMIWCKVCEKNVHIVNDIEDFDRKVKQGKCVSFDPKKVFEAPLKQSGMYDDVINLAVSGQLWVGD